MSEPDGQLWPKEREFLYNAVREAKPQLVLEIGTWKGGGSTLSIARALQDNGGGELWTCDADAAMTETAREVHLGRPFVHCLNMRSGEMIADMIRRKRIPDFLFFDGPEDEDTALWDFWAVETNVKQGTVFMMHDFDHPSIKAAKIRPYLEGSMLWKITGQLTTPDSVGLVKAVRV